MSTVDEAPAMTTTTQRARGNQVSAGPGLGAAVRVELAKLSAQLPLRVLLALCVVVPVVFAAGMRVSSFRPSDTLFGRWAGTSGFATSLFVLDWTAAWGVAVGAGLLAGDIFAGEDRLGTWKTLLTRSASRAQLFWGKAIAATIGVWLCWVVIGVASIAAGLVVIGRAPLIGLSGQLLAPGHALGLLAAAWAIGLLPATAFAALGVLFSVASRSSIIGVLGPLLVAILSQGLETVASGSIVRRVLLFTPFDAYHALFTSPIGTGAIVQAVVTSVLYTAVFGAASWWLLRRREFAGADAVPASRRRTVVQIGATVIVIGAVLAGVGRLGPTALTADRLSASVTTTFANLVAVNYLWHNDGKAADTTVPWHSVCARGVITPSTDVGSGAGEDWSCLITDTRASDGISAIQVEVALRANGCYEVQSPAAAVGPLQGTSVSGRSYLNPLFAFDGCLGTP
ncbi:MAG: ABC transporter permease [Microbacteriaceae bacterium]|nr:ABC transporter permease [Microbacteriaceae bacterium]MCL2795343.1 ABC transporter permease [Microbacteriaceae bacterium]